MLQAVVQRLDRLVAFSIFAYRSVDRPLEIYCVFTTSVVGKDGAAAAGAAGGENGTTVAAGGAIGAGVARGPTDDKGGDVVGTGSEPVVIGDTAAGDATAAGNCGSAGSAMVAGAVGSMWGGVVVVAPVFGAAGTAGVGVALAGVALSGVALTGVAFTGGAVVAVPGAAAVFGAPLVAVPSQHTSASALQVCSSKMPTSR